MRGCGIVNAPKVVRTCSEHVTHCRCTDPTGCDQPIAREVVERLGAFVHTDRGDHRRLTRETTVAGEITIPGETGPFLATRQGMAA